MLAAVAAALAVGLLVAAAITWSAAPSEVSGPASTGPVGAAPAAAPAAGASGAGRGAGSHRTASGGAAPRRVVVPALGVDAPVLPIVTQGQTLEPPSDPQSLGWWSQGAAPGAARGSALVTGHTVHDGGGALDDLEQLEAGARVRVVTARGRLDYVVASVVVLDKAAIARRAPQLFSQEVPGRLVLVTCEGWDGTGYSSNVVVTATPVE